MTSDLTSAYRVFGVVSSYAPASHLLEPDTEMGVELEVPVLLPPNRQYTQVFRIKHLGRAQPLISPDDVVSIHEL
ncbi:MAG: hypothetical protein CVU38_14380 [Chloroflexi bacterium HGW-Chloroflexi-1]|nr:MAG: hypothetical protein CVU38_14380 [Chloroflexi bacterium HGW-Chloroflexi-1]